MEELEEVEEQAMCRAAVLLRMTGRVTGGVTECDWAW
jgi:hypothetical protein